MEELYNYMYWGDYDKQMEVLADMALPKKWNVEGKGVYYILKNYMKYTFWRLRKEGKIVENENYCLFNTGLFTRYYEPIYVYGYMYMVRVI